MSPVVSCLTSPRGLAASHRSLRSAVAELWEALPKSGTMVTTDVEELEQHA